MFSFNCVRGEKFTKGIIHEKENICLDRLLPCTYPAMCV
jgi:hypothetical protein